MCEPKFCGDSNVDTHIVDNIKSLFDSMKSGILNSRGEKEFCFCISMGSKGWTTMEVPVVECQKSHPGCLVAEQLEACTQFIECARKRFEKSDLAEDPSSAGPVGGRGARVDEDNGLIVRSLDALRPLTLCNCDCKIITNDMLRPGWVFQKMQPPGSEMHLVQAND